MLRTATFRNGTAGIVPQKWYRRNGTAEESDSEQPSKAASLARRPRSAYVDEILPNAGGPGTACVVMLAHTPKGSVRSLSLALAGCHLERYSRNAFPRPENPNAPFGANIQDKPMPGPGFGVWQRKQLVLEAKTLAPQLGHVQSPGRTSPPPPGRPPPIIGPPPAAPGFGVWQRKQELWSLLTPHEGHVQSPRRTSS